MKLIFWGAVSLMLYTFAVYPLLLLALATLRQTWKDLAFACGRGERRQRAAGGDCPLVSLIFSAYNEERVIAEKMANCAALDYPPDRLEILVGCDGCSDGTAELARAARLPNARIFDFSERSGKLSVLNRLVAEARGNLIVFSDASTLLESGSVRTLLRHFSDPVVGCACGELRLFSPGGAPRAEGAYWRYEVFLKFLESRLDLLLGANGGIYAIRRELFRPLPRQAIIDDFLVAMNIRAEGYRLVYDPEAVAYEEAAPGMRDEFRRRTRIGAGNFHALRFTARLLNPLAGRVAFSYWSHKVFRWLVPFALPLAFLSALALSGRPFYRACAAALLTLGVMAVVGYQLDLRNRQSRWFSIPYYFLSMNLALLVGFLRFLRDSQGSVWERTARAERTEADAAVASLDTLSPEALIPRIASRKTAGSGAP